MAIPIPLQEALRDSITSGIFIDTKFWVFSKRVPNVGRVRGPRALYVSGHVVKRVPRLRALLDERKSGENFLRAGFPTDRKPYTSDYDYEDDSDLDDDAPDQDDERGVVPQDVAGKLGNNIKLAAAKSETSDESLDIISVSDPKPPDTPNPNSSLHAVKVVVIEDVAFVTFQALLRYLYTSEIEFASRGSTGNHKARAYENISEPYGIPKPSPKSIYRLADKYGIPELKELALQQIRQNISKRGVTEEVFSKYTSWYPELIELELRVLARTLLSSNPDHALELLKEKIESYAHGGLPHAKHVVSRLYEFMESDDNPVEEPPLPAVAPPHQQEVNGDWAGLKNALTNSLTSGVFLDTQLYAVESRTSTSLTKIHPIYFCSDVGGVSFVSKLMACSSGPEARRTLFQFGGGYDSDIEGEEPSTGSSSDCYLSLKPTRESSVSIDSSIDQAFLLKYGAAKTWSAILLYVYTGQIAFAAIGSQSRPSLKQKPQNDSLEDEGRSPRDNESCIFLPPGVFTMEPCSPKSVYCLANKVGLTSLCDIALEDIRSKLDENNIMEELFSPFTAGHKDIREMEHELFRSKLKSLVDHAVFSDIVKSSSSGEQPHCSKAMQLVLLGSVQDRRKRVGVAVNDTPQLDPMPQVQKSSEMQKELTQGGRSNFGPTPALQQPPSPNSSSASAPTMEEAPPDPTPPSESLGKTVALVEYGIPFASGGDSSPGDAVRLVCSNCGGKPIYTQSCWGLRCFSCPNITSPWHTMKCAGCGTIRAGLVSTCSC